MLKFGGLTCRSFYAEFCLRDCNIQSLRLGLKHIWYTFWTNLLDRKRNTHVKKANLRPELVQLVLVDTRFFFSANLSPHPEPNDFSTLGQYYLEYLWQIHTWDHYFCCFTIKTIRRVLAEYSVLSHSNTMSICCLTVDKI